MHGAKVLTLRDNVFPALRFPSTTEWTAGCHDGKPSISADSRAPPRTPYSPSDRDNAHDGAAPSITARRIPSS
ncbi:hypothetical protein OH76DRAFT_1030707 [Lentinus brumalis]|uniref:Uncharacterized protein n=1 Tax=Lentinus brumalis TaxID=2498619 RepID=A0A371CXF3_9APHY|nr:hypothetical protein OH76DRAFT_1030707 [Polyporus brumalis]